MSDDAKVSLGKGRPTPKRSEAQSRRGGPVLPPPATRREAAKRQRDQAAADRKAGRAGLKSGDPGSLLPRDQGPVRALVRDLVDSRRNVAVIMLPFALAYVAASFVHSDAVTRASQRLFTLALLLVIADLLAAVLTLRTRIRREFPGEHVRGHAFYGLLRSTIVRRLRMPPPRVKPPALFRR